MTKGIEKLHPNGLTDEQEKARLAGLRAVGCNPSNHPDWYTAFEHTVTRAKWGQRRAESLAQYATGQPVQQVVGIAGYRGENRA